MKGLTLRGVSFGNVFTSSGTLNFFGEGWQPHHRWRKILFKKRFDFTGATFIAKTTTLFPREGNMPLDDDLQPKELFPDCIKAHFCEGVVLNSVGLSGPGAENLLKRNKWQERTGPFMISFMSLGKNLEERLKEAEEFRDLLLQFMLGFRAPFGLQVNVSCPNTGHLTKDLINDSLLILEIFRPLGIPLDLKIGVVDALAAGIDFVKEIENSGMCDCLTCSNTIPWGKLPGRVNWDRLFGKVSPLVHLGGGGLSGKPLKSIVLGWLKSARRAGISMPIKGGGGILESQDALDYFRAGASAVEIGCVSILRPWRVQGIIQACNNYAG